MALPTLQLPTYELKIPSSGKEIRVRPFLVKEEKVLLMAAESRDEQEIISATKSIIKNCIIDGDVNVDTLPFFDIDFLFIALRAKSIGENIEMKFKCNNVLEDAETVCNHTFFTEIDIANATIDKDDSISNDIKLVNNVSIRMKYPTYAIMKQIESSDSAIDRQIKIIINSIDYIIEGDKVSSSKDFSKEELINFVENLTEEHFSKLRNYIENFPTFSVKLEAECTNCKFLHKLDYKDFNSFFY
jgi:hypothetical protein